MRGGGGVVVSIVHARLFAAFLAADVRERRRRCVRKRRDGFTSTDERMPAPRARPPPLVRGRRRQGARAREAASPAHPRRAGAQQWQRGGGERHGPRPPTPRDHRRASSTRAEHSSYAPDNSIELTS